MKQVKGSKSSDVVSKVDEVDKLVKLLMLQDVALTYEAPLEYVTSKNAEVIGSQIPAEVDGAAHA